MARAKLLPSLAVLAWSLSACAGGASGRAAPAGGSGDPWAGLATPRVTPLGGAARVAVGEIAHDASWGGAIPVPSSLGLQELVAAGLLRRGDVLYVERRRFSALAELLRRGEAPPAGAPALGTSPGAELILMGSSLELGDSTWLDLRLVDPGSGETRAAWRLALPRAGDPPGVARAIVGSLLGTLGGLQRLPEWDDPVAVSAPGAFAPSGIPEAAARAFLQGVAAEDRWDWDAARSAYLRALELGGDAFFEAHAALARTARLRAGGTLGAG